MRIDPHSTHKYSSAPVTASEPTHPYALYLSNHAGSFALLAIDFDTSRGDALADSDHLSAWLERARIPHLMCDSGGGGRHIWIRPQAPMHPKHVRELGALLEARYPSVDQAPLLNPAAGCVRAPGSPHRAGGRSTPRPTAGRTAMEAAQWVGEGAGLESIALLKSMIAQDLPADRRPRFVTVTKRFGVGVGKYSKVCGGGRGSRAARDTRRPSEIKLPGQRRPLSSRAMLLASTPLGGRDDPSAVAWSILLSGARARWSLADILDVALNQEWPGLEHLRTACAGAGRTPRPDPESHTARQWARALDTIEASPLLAAPRDPASSDALKLAGAVAAAAAADTTFIGGASNFTLRALLDTLLSVIATSGSSVVDLDYRRWGLLSGTSRSTVHRYLPQLMAEGWVVKTAEAVGPLAASYTVTIPAGRSLGTQGGPPPALGTLALGEVQSRLTHGRRDVWSSAVLGREGAAIHHLLSTTHKPTTTVLSELSGLSPESVDGILSTLRQAGLISSRPSSLMPLTSDRAFSTAARHLGVEGVGAARASRYRRESLVWAWWCAELDWRSARGRVAPAGLRASLGGFPAGAGAWARAMLLVDDALRAGTLPR